MLINKTHKQAEEALLASITELPNWSRKRVEKITSNRDFQAALIQIFTTSSKTTKAFRALHGQVTNHLQTHQRARHGAQKRPQVIVDDDAMQDDTEGDGGSLLEEDQLMEEDAAEDEEVQ